VAPEWQYLGAKAVIALSARRSSFQLSIRRASDHFCLQSGIARALDIEADWTVPPLEDTQKALATNVASETGHGAHWLRGRAGHAAPDQAND
jgi:hypothetical protein